MVLEPLLQASRHATGTGTEFRVPLPCAHQVLEPVEERSKKDGYLIAEAETVMARSALDVGHTVVLSRATHDTTAEWEHLRTPD